MPARFAVTDIYTVTANLAGIPSLSLPCGFTKEGLPVGLQILGNQFQEGTLLQLAQAYMQEFPFSSPPLKV